MSELLQYKYELNITSLVAGDNEELSSHATPNYKKITNHGHIHKKYAAVYFSDKIKEIFDNHKDEILLTLSSEEFLYEITPLPMQKNVSTTLDSCYYYFLHTNNKKLYMRMKLLT